jgi:hypothetical protein
MLAAHVRMSAAAGPHCCSDEMMERRGAREKESSGRRLSSRVRPERNIIVVAIASGCIFASSFLACSFFAAPKLRAQITLTKKEKL